MPCSRTTELQPDRRAQVLLLAPVMPSDRGNGLAMRAGFFLDAYAQSFDVDVVVAPVAGSAELSSFVRNRARRTEILKFSGADTHYRLVAAVADPQARLRAFRSYGRPSLAACVGPALPYFRSLVVDRRYDIVHIVRLYLAEMAAPWLSADGTRTQLVIDCDENDVITYRRIAAMERQAGNLMAADMAEAEAAGFARFTERWLPQFDVVIAASHPEARSLALFGARTLTIPNVVSAPRQVPRRPARVPTLLFVGTLGYAPNRDAITWFFARVFRRLQRALAYGLRLIIVGRHPPAVVGRLGFQRGIEVWDHVADIASCYSAADLVIVPLRAGGGTRIKIIEAASFGVPIVTTTVGAEGTSFQNGVDMLMADDEENFLRACLLLMRNRSLARRLASQARTKAKRHYAQAYWRRQVINLVAPREATRSCTRA